MSDTVAEQATIAIKKYPNRRYYDSSQSRHVTLEQIHQLIRDGNEVSVTDSKTGEDITSRVLAQIILEMDSLKLSLFPSQMLHMLIQSNESIVHEFVEVYFSQAFDWFLSSRQMFESHFRKAVGLHTNQPDDQAADAPGQSPAMPFPPMHLFAPRQSASSQTPPPDLHNKIEQLNHRLEALQSHLVKTESNDA